MQHIMIDLEMNKIEKQWRGKNKLSSELIEIGAVRMGHHSGTQPYPYHP